MSVSYPACLNLYKLHLSVYLGRWDEERARLQPVEVSVKFFFPELPPASRQDDSEVMCYDALAAELETYVKDKRFLHIEYLTIQLYEAIRANMLHQMGDAYREVKIWIRMHKIGAPIPALTGGASFVYTDLPDGVLLGSD